MPDSPAPKLPIWVDAPAPNPAIWSCQIGEVDRALLPQGSDLPMRNAVAMAYWILTGRDPDFIFSGWGDTLSDIRRQVVNEGKNRPDARSL